ncbi:MAG: hypothetical protein LBM93_07065 [Oscillospiraceae bacterium]|jgi:hypothetical protein|nr:hypothetical protein [Oscillospiraceae bacterium]
MKRRKKNMTVKVISIWLYIIANIGVYYGLNTYCDMQNINNAEKITPANVTVNKSDIEVTVLNNEYIIDTSYKENKQLKEIIYHITPKLFRVIEKGTENILPKHTDTFPFT